MRKNKKKKTKDQTKQKARKGWSGRKVEAKDGKDKRKGCIAMRRERKQEK